MANPHSQEACPSRLRLCRVGQRTGLSCFTRQPDRPIAEEKKWPEWLEEQALAGAGGFKVHEDWGSTPAAIDAALRGAEEWGLQVALHADSLNEAGFVQDTVAAIAGRSISAFHVEGAGGGHAPDILTLVSQGNVLPGSTNPTCRTR